MATTPTGVYVQNPKITPMSFVNADGTTKKTLVTAGANGSKVVGLLATTNDTSSRIINLWLTRAATSYQLQAVTVTTLAGTDGATAPINLLAAIPGLPVDNDGQPYLFLESGDTLQGSMAVAVTAAKETDVVAVFGNF